MKRAFIWIFTLLVCSTFLSCMAENFDFSQKTYEELLSIKLAVDSELRSRPESAPFILTQGSYTVGKEIKAGHYYVIAVEPTDYSPEMRVYSNQDVYEQRPQGKTGNYIYRQGFVVGTPAKRVELEDGNFVIVLSAAVKLSVSEFAEGDYYTYTPPEGTYVPAGVYIVGEDIPAGTYRMHAATFETGYASIYINTSPQTHEDLLDFPSIDLKGTPAYETIRLENGNMIEIEVDVILQKQPKLDFEW